MLAKTRDELRRYGVITRSGQTPLVGLDLLTNVDEAVPRLSALLREANVPGRVVVRRD